MKALAPELLHEIWTLACIDGGFTGCSLSLVSKDIRNASRSARFNSVAISGTSKQLTAFLNCFSKELAIAKAEGGGYRPVVKHLFFAAAEGSEVREDWREDLNLFNILRGDADPAEVARKARVDAASTQYRQDLAALFRLVSRDLQTLSFVHCHGWYTFTNLPPIECPDGFPALRELYLYGKNPFVDATGSPVNLPHLTHLRLPFSSYSKEEDLVDWATRAPEVTHLCISYIMRVTQGLEDIATEKGPFKKLSHLYLEPQSPPAPGGRCGNPYIAYGKYKIDFDNFLAAATLAKLKALPHRIRGVSTEKAAMEEWLDRIGGGTGCWIPIEPRPADWVPAKRQNLWM
ncbi:hypothetical protein L226DRAFT_529714 [Lentinus tigrinus ALCF2SS1-7]|uniref:uncharacterized protein n=1 Tax=Lentinus tigrinus ALCF2SS1-7 TaxID=1328758 RepID=UPI00116635B5|nr:hypothetical protein L226DRAFT_529714 [Lentinus tigrinus ALCF2SS1-7]